MTCPRSSSVLSSSSCYFLPAIRFPKPIPGKRCGCYGISAGGAALLFAVFLLVRGAIGPAVSIGLVRLGLLGYVSINPMLVKGQIMGGIAQGLGQVLMEDKSYDDAGQVLTGSFMDYAMPRADDFCTVVIEDNPVPTPTNPLGLKGAGEAGTVARSRR